MRKRLMLIAVALAGCGPEPSSAPLASDPASVVSSIYEPYLTETAALSPLLDAAPWSDELRDALSANGVDAAGLTFDPFIHAQDWQLTNFEVADQSVVLNHRATVEVRFMNFGQPDEVLYDLVWDEGWRVADVRGADWSLRGLLASGAESETRR